MSNEPLPEINSDPIIARIEALLFVAASSVLPTQLAIALDLPLRVIENSLEILERSLVSDIQPRGLRLQHHHGQIGRAHV
jgi:hypothetical protein